MVPRNRNLNSNGENDMPGTVLRTKANMLTPFVRDKPPSVCTRLPFAPAEF